MNIDHYFECQIETPASFNSLTVSADLSSNGRDIVVQPMIRVTAGASGEISSNKIVDWPESEMLYLGLICDHIANQACIEVVLGNEMDGYRHFDAPVQTEYAGATMYLGSIRSRKGELLKYIDIYFPKGNDGYDHWHMVFAEDEFKRFAAELLSKGRAIEEIWSKGPDKISE